MNAKSAFLETGHSLNNLKHVILSEWEQRVRSVISESRHEQSIILLDHIPDILEQLIILIKEGEISEVELGKSHGFHRVVLTHYSIADLLTELSLLREVLIDYLYPMGNISCSKLVHKYIDILSKHSAIEFMNDQTMKRSLEREQVGSELKEIKNNPVIPTH